MMKRKASELAMMSALMMSAMTDPVGSGNNHSGRMKDDERMLCLAQEIREERKKREQNTFKRVRASKPKPERFAAIYRKGKAPEILYNS